MQFNVGDEVEIVRLTADAGAKFKVGDITRILKIIKVNMKNTYKQYLLEVKGDKDWWVAERCIKLVNFSLENT